MATGAKNIAMPKPDSANGTTMLEYGSVVVRIAAIHRADGLQREPGGHDRAAADPVGEEPAIGATKIGIAVQGRMRSPDCSGESPCTVWRNWASRKIEPNIPKNMNSDATFAAVKVRLRKNRIGSIGASVRSSQARRTRGR